MSEAEEGQVMEAKRAFLAWYETESTGFSTGYAIQRGWLAGVEWQRVKDRAEIERWTDRLLEAAAEIERLRERVKELEEKANCDHERLNDHGDACLDCHAVYLDGKWQ